MADKGDERERNEESHACCSQISLDLQCCSADYTRTAAKHLKHVVSARKESPHLVRMAAL